MAVKVPTGLAVARENDKWTLTWKNADEYTGHSVHAYALSGPNTIAKPYWTTTPRDATSQTITWNRSDFYPNTDIKIITMRFWTRGWKGQYTSAWVYKDFNLSTPRKPTITVNHSSEHENVTTFEFLTDWENPPANQTGGNIIFTNYKWWSSLLKNSNLDPEKVTNWQESGVISTETGTKTFTETGVYSDNNSYTRYFKLMARGPKGDGVPAYAKYVYAMPNPARNVKAKATRLSNGSGYRVSVQFDIDETKARPIDDITIEYAIAVPNSSGTSDVTHGIRKVQLEVPDIASWTSVSVLKNEYISSEETSGKRSIIQDLISGLEPYQQKKNGISTGFIINGTIESDKCIFLRVVTKKDTHSVPSETVFVDNGYGELSAPTNLSTSLTTTTANVTVTNNCAISESIIGIYYRSDVNTKARLVGIWYAGRTAPISITLPSESATQVSFGARAFVASYSPITEGAKSYALSDVAMKSSKIVWASSPVPMPPSNITLTSPKTGVARITWDWAWNEADGVELSWADHEDAWESTDEPTTYVIPDRRASAWNIAGLDVGTWYFRVRLFKYDGEAEVYGTYSDIHSIKIVSVPPTPVLTLSPSIVAPNGKLSCYWAFSAEDGDEQSQADICEVTMSSSGVPTYGQIVARARNAQSKTINIKELGWTANTKHYLAVRIITMSGEKSGSWSIPKSVDVANPVKATIQSTSLVAVSGVKHLTSMPFTVKAKGAGEGGTMTFIIERASDYHLTRPDENDTYGYEGETVAIIQKNKTITENNIVYHEVSIGRKNLLGKLDDGAPYNLIVIAKDSYGQTSTPVQIPFEVHWTHQAVMPVASVSVDNERLVTFIQLTQPSGYALGDTCDIYRLSIDKPELIYEGAAMGTTNAPKVYVDPYPTLGKNGGHRVVYKTVDGDYITANNRLAWRDYDYQNGDLIDKFATIIDFGDDQVILPYDLSLSTKWAKDFTQTKYLGGSIEGDWNPAVERTGSIKTRVAVQQDSELIELIRRLAVYPGVCNVRTPDGSSFAANVDVSEDREEQKINKIASFGLEITRVDTQKKRGDGMTYKEWINNE